VTEGAAAGRALGCVAVDVAFSGEDATDPRLLSRLVDGIGFIARAFDAEVRWEEDQARLSISAAQLSDIGERTLCLARELWIRIVFDLDLPARIVADVVDIDPGEVRSAPPPRLLPEAGPGAVTVSERLALLARPESRAMLRPCGGGGPPLYSLSSGKGPSGGSSRADWLKLWERVERAHQRPEISALRYVGLRLGKKAPPVLALGDVFVEPNARVVGQAFDRRPARATPRGARARPMEAESRPVSRLLAEHRQLILLGEPGSGKTTLLRWLALETASGRLPDLLGRAEPTLPILLHAGRFASLVSDQGEPPAQALARHSADIVEARESTLAAFFSACLSDRRLLLLLDGLDEVRPEERAALDRWLGEFLTRYPSSRWIITSRFVGYTGLHLPAGLEAGRTDGAALKGPREASFPAVEAHLEPLSAEARERFVRGFARAYVAWEHAAPGGGAPPDPRPLDAIAAQEADGLLEALSGSERLAALGSNPFMLSSLALIHRSEGRLPRHRAQAYETMARTLCETWEQARRLVAQATQRPALAYEEEALPVLGDLSLEMHTSYPMGVAPVSFIEEKLARSLMNRRGEDRATALTSAREFLRRASEEAPILAERGQGQWGFGHLTFQEFFIVAGLHADERFEEVGLEHLIESRWEEILRLGVGYMALVQKRPRAVARFVEAALKWQAPEPWTEAVAITGKPVAMAAVFAAEAGDTLPAELSDKIAREFVRWIVRWGSWKSFRYRRGIWLRQMALMDDWAARLSDRLYGSLKKAKTKKKREMLAQAAKVLRVQWTVEQVREVIPDACEPAVYPLGEILSRIASPNDMQELSRDPRVGARCALAWALHFCEGSVARDPTLTLLGDKACEVRAWALDAVFKRTEVSHELQMPVLDALMSVSVRDQWRASHYFSVVEVSATVLSALLARTRMEEHPEALEWALGVLAWANHPDAFEKALSLAVERWGSFALNEVVSDFAEAAIEKNKVPLVQHGLQSTNHFLRAFCSLIVAQILFAPGAENAAAEVVALRERVLMLARDPSPAVRQCLFEHLDPRRGRDVRRALIAGCQDRSPEVRRSTYASLAKAVLSSTAPVLRAGLSDPDPSVRRSSLAVVPHLPPPEMASALRAALNDADAGVRAEVARQLDKLASFVPNAIARLASDDSERVRTAVAYELSEKGSDRNLSVLRRLLNDDSARVRDIAAYAFSKASDNALPLLVQAARRSPEFVFYLWDFLDDRRWVIPPAVRRASRPSRRKGPASPRKAIAHPGKRRQ
jgi:HEAT repeat protein